MSHKILIGTALVAALVLGYAGFTTGSSPAAPTTPVQNQSGYTIQTGTKNSTTTGTSPTSATSFTLVQVATHNNASSCWSAVNGKVYNLTSWINQHPGGTGPILSLCGTDGSAAFNGKHGGQARPASELASFYVGTLTQ